MILCRMPKLVEKIAKFLAEYDYDDEVSFSKFLKRHGGSYTQEEFLIFLKRRYEVIYRLESPNCSPSDNTSQNEGMINGGTSSSR